MASPGARERFEAAAAGTPETVFEIASADLARCTSGTIADFAV